MRLFAFHSSREAIRVTMALCPVLLLSAMMGAQPVLGQPSGTQPPGTQLLREATPAPPPAGQVPPEIIQSGPPADDKNPRPDSTARSGVIQPPAGIDPGIQATPPTTASGAIIVIPPPGSPGGDPRVQPK